MKFATLRNVSLSPCVPSYSLFSTWSLSLSIAFSVFNNISVFQLLKKKKKKQPLFSQFSYLTTEIGKSNTTTDTLIIAYVSKTFMSDASQYPY